MGIHRGQGQLMVYITVATQQSARAASARFQSRVFDVTFYQLFTRRAIAQALVILNIVRNIRRFLVVVGFFLFVCFFFFLFFFFTVLIFDLPYHYGTYTCTYIYIFKVEDVSHVQSAEHILG